MELQQLILKKKKLIDISKNLTKVEYIEIFNIIKVYNHSYTENKNGIFINLAHMQEEIIDKIFQCIEFIHNSKDELNKHEEYVNTVKKNMEDSIKKDVVENNFIQKTNNETYYEMEDEPNATTPTGNNPSYLNFSSDDEDANVTNDKLMLKKKRGAKAKK